MRFLIISLLLACTQIAFALTEELPDSSTSRRGLKGVYDKVTTFFDSTRVRGHDPRYIEMPKHPWSVMVQNAFDQTELRMKSYLDGEQFPDFEFVENEFIKWEPRILTKTSTSIGAWVGYRGHGVGYAVNVGGDKGTDLTLTSTGKFYSVNFRYHTFKTDEPEVTLSGRIKNEDTGEYEYDDETEKIELPSPIKARTVYLNGFYIFNYKKFSYAAARRQAVIQKRSAGSPIAGISFFHSKYEYDTDPNAAFVILMGKVGCIKQWQASVSAGYSYNWVPAKGWLINATLLPSLAFYDKIKVSLYDADYLGEEENAEDYDEEDFRLRPLGKDTRYGHVSINFDARATVAYQWSRYFVSAYAQFDTFSYKYKASDGRINDWCAKASFGVRF